MKHLMILLLSLTAVGCSTFTTTANLGRKAQDYNRALEDSVNVTALANVIRAYRRLPLVYSRMGSMTYTGSTSREFGAAIGLGADENNDMLTTELELDDGGSVVFDALVGQKFYNAIQRSISPSTISFYRDRGWPDYILFTLFVERVSLSEIQYQQLFTASTRQHIDEIGEFCAEQPPVERSDCVAVTKVDDRFVIDNDPGSPRQFLMFLRLLNNISSRYIIELNDNPPSEYPSNYCNKSGGLLEERAEVFSSQACQRLKGFSVAYHMSDIQGFNPGDLLEGERFAHGVVFQRLPSANRVEFRAAQGNDGETPDGCKIASFSGAFDDSDDDAAGSGDDKTVVEVSRFDEETGEVVCEEVQKGSDAQDVELVLRSPDGMLYYLGELVRAQYAEGYARDLHNDSRGGDEDGGIAANNYRSLCDANFPKSGFANVDPGPFHFRYRDACSKDGDSLFRVDTNQFGIGTLTPEGRINQLFAFDLHGSRYWVPSGDRERGRTMQYLSLINEIFFLNQESSDAPAVSILQGTSIQ